MIEFFEYKDYREKEILSLYSSVGWTSYTRDPEMLREAFGHSLYSLAAYDGERLVGMIRTVGDGYSVVFIQDLLVHPDFQRRGIGSRLLTGICEKFSAVYQLELLTDDLPSRVAFYRSMGFVPVSERNCLAFIRQG